MSGAIALVIVALAAAGFALSRRKALRVAGDRPATLHSRPVHHGLYSGLWVLLAGLGALLAASLIGHSLVEGALMRQIHAAGDFAEIEARLILSDARALAAGGVASRIDATRRAAADSFAAWDGLRFSITAALSICAALAALGLTLAQVSLTLRARNRAETLLRGVLFACATVAVLTTLGIVASLTGETLSFFSQIDWRIFDFLFGTVWSPLSGVQDGAIDPARVGALPLFAGTFMITMIAMLVAAPVGLFAAIYLSEFASPRVRGALKPMLEILAGIPTVVYGFFAAITVAPFLRGMGEALGLGVASESALAAGVVMGIMIIPFISSLSDDVINAVPQSLRDGSYALGATQAETIRQVVLPAALPGIVSAMLLGASRAVGETMIVVMAAGQGANLTANPLEAVTTVTVQIVMLITGDTEAATAAGPAFALSFTLFCVTLGLNVIALRIVRKYREAYE